MNVTAWNNGKHHASGAGYGIKLSVKDRDRYFKPEWKIISLYLGNNQSPISVNIGKPSFWNPTCRELIHKEIGRWLISNNLAPWKRGHPPKLSLTFLENNQFRLSR
jgi:hypothetical protein